MENQESFQPNNDSPIIEPTQPPVFESQQSVSPKKNSWLVPFLFMVILVLLASTAFFAYLYYQTQNVMVIDENKEQVEIDTPEPTAEITSNEIEVNPDTTKPEQLNITGTFQDFLIQNCQLGNPNYIEDERIPFNFDTKFIQLSSSINGQSTYCSSTKIDTISNAYLTISTSNMNNIYVSDSDSQELGHGGAPFIGFFGEEILSKDNTQISAYFDFGSGPSLLGNTGITIRGVKHFETSTGSEVTVTLTTTGVAADDSRLIEALTPYAVENGFEELYIEITDDMRSDIIRNFFENPQPDTPEAMAIAEMELALAAISAKK